ncbi:MAG: hypothetical protein QNK19_02865 [Xanthomonadales bacterium]|nr:hypothetical protein [Xanthomonadales bacterium]
MKIIAISMDMIFLAMLMFKRNFSSLAIKHPYLKLKSRKSKRKPPMQTHTGYITAYNTIFRLPSICFLMLSCVAANADASFPDRRKDQFPSSAAHLIVPLPYSYPGVGDGFFLMGNFSNLRETTTDFLAMLVTGDAVVTFCNLTSCQS